MPGSSDKPGAGHRTESESTVFVTLWRSVRQRWRSLQVGHQGSYSVERLVSLDRYCKTSSRVRVALVCVLTPLPSLLVIVLLECLPLRPPSDGWAANWVFWIRLGFTVFAMTFAGMAQLSTFVPDLNATFQKILVVAVGATIGFTTTAILAAVFIGFPIPLLWILGGSAMSIYVPAMTVMVFGLAPFRANSNCRPNFQKFFRYFFAWMTLADVFPFCKVLYEFIPTSFRGVVISLLPLWRFAAKQFMVMATRELEDFMPEIVAFSVDFFSALFVSVCMSTGGSVYLAVIFILADTMHSLLELHDVREMYGAITRLVQNEQSCDTQGHGKNEPAHLVSMILSVTRSSGRFLTNTTDDTRQWACLPRERVHRLNRLQGSGFPNKDKPKPKAKSYYRRIRFLLGPSIMPAPTSPAGPLPAIIPEAAVKNTAKHHGRNASARSGSSQRLKKIGQRGLRVLFHWEYVALVEYVECIVRLVFVVYKSVLRQLPNAIYYPNGGGHLTNNVLVSVLVFGTLETVTFLLLCFYLQWKFALCPLLQLAFVLETHMHSVQSKLMIETILLLQYELAHLGTDFTFRIEWLNDQQ